MKAVHRNSLCWPIRQEVIQLFCKRLSDRAFTCAWWACDRYQQPSMAIIVLSDIIRQRVDNCSKVRHDRSG
jgi:hypothetical protein